MKTRLFHILISCLIISPSFGQSTSTLLGLRAGSSPNLLHYYEDLNAKVSRQIIKDHSLSVNQISEFKSQLQVLRDNGVQTIVCLRFPKEVSDSDQNDRSPYLDPVDIDSSLHWARQMVLELDGALDYIQIQNEPIAGPGKYLDFSQSEPLHLGYYAYKWMDTLGYTLRKTITDNNLNIKIAGPAFHSVENALPDGVVENPFTFIQAPGDTIKAGQITTVTAESYFVSKMIEVSKSHADIIDLHLNVENTLEIEDRIQLMDELQMLLDPTTILPYSTFEWSQTKEKQDLILDTPTYRAFLESAYASPVTLSEWESFMLDSLNYDTDFMADAFEIFQEHDFVHACYAGLIQYGSVINDMIFSTCALITNRVTDPEYPNEPFYTLFKTLAEQEIATYIENINGHKSRLKIYPNPFIDHIILHTESVLNGEITISIYDIQGQLISNFSGNELPVQNEFTIRLDLSEILPSRSGLFILNVKENNHTTVYKVMRN